MLTWVLRIVGESVMKLRLSAGFNVLGGGDVWRESLGRFGVADLPGGITESMVSDLWL